MSLLLLLGLFAGYLTCIFGFTHVHIIDGVRIVHSHPYSADHEQKSHTSAELVLLADISNFISTSPAVVNFDFTPHLTSTGKLAQVLPLEVPASFSLPFFLRGPPVL
ncbi:MAG: hypothetical protein ACRCSQ_04005 [Bacteroidales bacterium]